MCPSARSQPVWPGAGQAETAPAENGFTDPSIGPTPEGWSGRALQPGGYEVNLTVRKGVGDYRQALGSRPGQEAY